ncbi:leucine-rich repeat domain-containing protein [Algibacter lectus]|uniref:Uncharacterized protein n=1 Tax=Algibacter lectus TaxID=221126 RepID=A0A4R8M6K2_9FLAO|nr:leucine-rich repeat domain-containing protein [Algibacter lectus]MWW25728.1 hypothetical protein [Algibacter lectus]TDY61009.1 hypothetical protein DFQ06_3018 [Algibacter lectus]
MAINYYDDRVQVSHKLNKNESNEVNEFLHNNPDKALRLYWFEDTKELSFVSEIPNAKNISIDYSKLDNIDFLSALPNIEKLDISEMTGNLDVNAIKNFKNLKILNLSLNKATKQTDLSILNNGIALEEFYFSGKFKKNSLNLNTLKNIKVLAPQLSTINFKELSDLNQLKEIRLFNQKIGSLDGIEKFTSVENLMINGVKMENQDNLSPIFKLPKLTILNLSYVKFIKDFTFIKSSHNLKCLYLWTLNGLESYKGIEKLTSLQKLSHCGEHKNPNDINFDNIENLKNLMELEIKVGRVNEMNKRKIEKLIKNICC